MLISPKCESTSVNSTHFKCTACRYEIPKKNGVPCFSPELSEHNQGFDRRFFSELAKVEDGHFWFEARNRLILSSMHRFFPRSGRFLEIGCGTGFVLREIQRQFSQYQLTGSEIYTEGLKFASERLPQVQFMQFDARRLPFSSYFDGIGAFDVIEHIEEDERVLKEIHKALKPEGAVILSVPQHMFLWSRVDEQAFHKRRYSKNELVEKVRRAGFEVVYATSFMSLLLPIMFLTRFSKKKKVADEMAEFRISGVTNGILSWVLAVEYFATSTFGVTCPAGGSLLLVARKLSSPDAV
jgi:SAM-dependent methyltransferase